MAPMARRSEPFVVKDSGKREEFPSGMRRDTEDGKLDYTFLFDGPMADRYCDHMGKGAVKYGRNNWMNACSPEELERFKRSALRHMRRWLRGDIDEDHAMGILFNVNAALFVEERLAEEPTS